MAVDFPESLAPGSWELVRRRGTEFVVRKLVEVGGVPDPALGLVR